MNKFLNKKHKKLKTSHLKNWNSFTNNQQFILLFVRCSINFNVLVDPFSM
jgi:hypothetical protein